jgi:hypothetical protein
MKPLPKWVNWVGNLGALGSLVGSFGGILPMKYGLIVTALGAWLNSVSHSLPGTGGK